MPRDLSANAEKTSLSSISLRDWRLQVPRQDATGVAHHDLEPVGSQKWGILIN